MPDFASYIGKAVRNERIVYEWERGWSIDTPQRESRFTRWWVNVPSDQPVPCLSKHHAYAMARYFAKSQGVELERVPELLEEEKRAHSAFMGRRHEYAKEIGVDAYAKY